MGKSDASRDPGSGFGTGELSALEARIVAAGNDAGDVAAAFANLAPDADVLNAVASQPEHARTPGAYVQMLATDARAGKARRLAADHRETLDAITRTVQVPAGIVLAIWGIESQFGAAMGRFRTVRALTTLALRHRRRVQFWEGELAAAFKIARELAITPERLTGSWAGALGHTQFIPSTYLGFAVDFDDDGRRDLIGSVPDALASAANLLASSGWQPGLPWGFETTLPAAFDFAAAGPDVHHQLDDWRALGLAVARADGAGVDDAQQPYRLLLPEGAVGPAFLVSVNFDAILAYNAAMPYALAVGLLADAIAGRHGPRTPWLPANEALSLAERKALQAGLVALGWETGGVDGILGRRSVAAVRAFQARIGLPQDGFATRALLGALERAVARRDGA